MNPKLRARLLWTAVGLAAFAGASFLLNLWTGWPDPEFVWKICITVGVLSFIIGAVYTVRQNLAEEDTQRDDKFLN